MLLKTDILPIVKYPKKILTEKSLKVDKITSEIKDLVHKMVYTMYAENGLGISAVQVGELLNIIVISPIAIAKDENTPPLVLINPEVLDISKEKEILNEGCLSFPNLFIKVKRSKSITIKYLGLDSTEYMLTANGLLGQVIQHELEHLNGKLFIENLSSFNKDYTAKKYLKNNKASYPNEY